MDTLTSYPVFKGMQKPLELMGIRGRFLYYIAAALGAGFLGYIICAIFLGQIAGLFSLAVFALGGYLYSFVMQRRGLHSKKREKATLIVQSLFSR